VSKPISVGAPYKALVAQCFESIDN